MRITRVYTKVGDRGTTRLVGGHEVAKNSPRIEAYGTVDELNSVIGLAREFHRGSGVDGTTDEEVDGVLRAVQNDLFNVGADLATQSVDRWPGMYQVGQQDVTRLEQWCDHFNAALEPLQEFVLPGGGRVGAFLHHARTVCRRAERHVVALVQGEPDVGEGCIVYLNRLSDLLFVLARYVAKRSGAPEAMWQQPPRPATEA